MPRTPLREKDFDLNRDEMVTQDEVNIKSAISALELHEEKAESQKKMAWVALVAIIVFTAFMFSPWVPGEKAQTLANLSDIFYVSMASIIGAYMGFTSWVARK